MVELENFVGCRVDVLDVGMEDVLSAEGLLGIVVPEELVVGAEEVLVVEGLIAVGRLEDVVVGIVPGSPPAEEVEDVDVDADEEEVVVGNGVPKIQRPLGRILFSIIVTAPLRA